ncbi:unnamed protein product, partial [Prorocentrum cordatum]
MGLHPLPSSKSTVNDAGGLSASAIDLWMPFLEDSEEPPPRRGGFGADDRDLLGTAVGRLLSAPAAVAHGRGTPARSAPQGQ